MWVAWWVHKGVVRIWRSEDKLGKSVLPFLLIGPEDQTPRAFSWVCCIRCETGNQSLEPAKRWKRKTD